MAAAKKPGETGSAAGMDRSNPSLEDLLQSLKIKGEDLGGVFVPKAEVEALKEGSKWMAVLKVLTSKTFSTSSLMRSGGFLAPFPDRVCSCSLCLRTI